MATFESKLLNLRFEAPEHWAIQELDARGSPRDDGWDSVICGPIDEERTMVALLRNRNPWESTLDSVAYLRARLAQRRDHTTAGRTHNPPKVIEERDDLSIAGVRGAMFEEETSVRSDTIRVRSIAIYFLAHGHEYQAKVAGRSEEIARAKPDFWHLIESLEVVNN